jgi:Na+:H+ antiporter, NhaA family
VTDQRVQEHERHGVAASEARAVVRAAGALKEFLSTEAAGGAVMLVGVVVALVWINTASHSYHEVFEHRLHLDLGAIDVDKTVHGWINEGLMAIFFFVVGIEIKREVVAGELRDPRTAALPVIAAVGGMIVPALIFVLLNGTGGDAGKGWGVPVATDIAFATGVLVLLGHRVPPSAKIFLLTLAVADDVGGIVVIAVFYASDVAPEWLLVAAAAFAAVPVLRRLGAAHPLAYVPVALIAWYALVKAGIEPAIAGVVLGLLTPAVPVKGREVMAQLEHRLAPWAAFVIVPLFAIANAGVKLGPSALGDAFGEPVTWGVALGLWIGKTIGITAATVLAVKLGVGRLGTGIRTAHVVGVAMMGGVGFTVALFVASLAFEDAPGVLEHAKIGVFLGSTISALFASLLLTAVGRRYPQPRPPTGPVDRDGDGWIDADEVEEQLLAAVDSIAPHVPHPHVPHPHRSQGQGSSGEAEPGDR